MTDLDLAQEVERALAPVVHAQNRMGMSWDSRTQTQKVCDITWCGRTSGEEPDLRWSSSWYETTCRACVLAGIGEQEKAMRAIWPGMKAEIRDLLHPALVREP